MTLTQVGIAINTRKTNIVCAVAFNSAGYPLFSCITQATDSVPDLITAVHYRILEVCAFRRIKVAKTVPLYIPSKIIKKYKLPPPCTTTRQQSLLTLTDDKLHSWLRGYSI
jgi:hypothetical protein